MMKRNPHMLLGAVAVALLAACGGGGSDAGAEIPADANVIVTAVTGNQLDAASYSAQAGDVKIAYIGEPTTNHTLLVASADGTTIGAKLKIAPGKNTSGTYSLTAGTYQLLCDVPGHDKMKADLVVA